MADPFYGEIRAFGFTYPPQDWLPCDGRQLPINTNQVLYAVIGNTYGGSYAQGVFNLPNLQGCIAMGRDPSQVQFDQLGETGGTVTETLSVGQIANHTHNIKAVIAQGTTNIPGPTVSVAVAATITSTPKANIAAYSNTASVAMSPASLGVAGTGAPHNNMGPYLVMNYCICVSNGIWPQRP